MKLIEGRLQNFPTLPWFSYIDKTDTEAASEGILSNKVFSAPQNSQDSKFTCIRVSFLKQVFSCEMCEIFKIFSTEYLALYMFNNKTDMFN